MPLNHQQSEALRHLLAGKTHGQTAKIVGCRPETVGRWRKLPAFVDALKAATDPDLTDADTNITYLKWKSYDTLLSALESDSDTVRVKAAGEVFRLFGTRLGQYQGAPAEPVEDLAKDD